MLREPDDEDVRRIAAAVGDHCATVYGPIDEWRGETRRPPGRAGAAIRAATQGLRERGADDTTIEAFESTLGSVIAQGSAEDSPCEGIAVFATANEVTVFGMMASPHPVVHVGDRFLVAPMLAGVHREPRSAVLALSENRVRLVGVSPEVRELVVPGLPTDLKSTIRLDLSGDRDTLAHLRTSEDPKLRLAEYARAIDAALRPYLAQEPSLLILAAVEQLAETFRHVSDYPDIADAIMYGNHDDATPHALSREAAPILAEKASDEARRSLRRFAELPEQTRAVEPGAVLFALGQGAVETLLVDPDSITSAGDAEIDAIEEAVRGALRTRAEIVLVEKAQLPATTPLAAILRYPVAAAESS